MIFFRASYSVHSVFFSSLIFIELSPGIQQQGSWPGDHGWEMRFFQLSANFGHSSLSWNKLLLISEWLQRLSSSELIWERSWSELRKILIRERKILIRARWVEICSHLTGQRPRIAAAAPAGSPEHHNCSFLEYFVICSILLFSENCTSSLLLSFQIFYYLIFFIWTILPL